MTTGCMKTSSLIFSTFLMWPSSINSLISVSTACSCTGILRPFCWIILASFLNTNLTLTAFIFSCLENIFGTFFLIVSFSLLSEMLLNMFVYSLFPLASPTLKLSCVRQSRPINDRLPSLLMTILAFFSFRFPTWRCTVLNARRLKGLLLQSTYCSVFGSGLAKITSCFNNHLRSACVNMVIGEPELIIVVKGSLFIFPFLMNGWLPPPPTCNTILSSSWSLLIGRRLVQSG